VYSDSSTPAGAASTKLPMLSTSSSGAKATPSTKSTCRPSQLLSAQTAAIAAKKALASSNLTWSRRTTGRTGCSAIRSRIA